MLTFDVCQESKKSGKGSCREIYGNYVVDIMMMWCLQ